MTGFITFILGIIYVIVSGYFIGSAVVDFKNERYIAFGVNIAIVIWFTMLIVKRVFLFGFVGGV